MHEFIEKYTGTSIVLGTIALVLLAFVILSLRFAVGYVVGMGIVWVHGDPIVFAGISLPVWTGAVFMILHMVLSNSE